MPITLNDAIRRSRSRLDEPAFPSLPGSSGGVPPQAFFKDTELTDWVNDGLRDIARRTETLFTYDTTLQLPPYSPAASVIPTYPLPTDVIQIFRVEFIPVGSTTQVYKLEASTQNEMDQIWGTYEQDQSSYPNFWVTRGYAGGTGRHAFGIQIYPFSSQGGQLNLHYYGLPARMLDPGTYPSEYNSYLDCVEGWDDLIVDFVHYHGLIKRNDPAWQGIKQLYEQKLGEMIDVTRKVSDQPGYVQPSLMNGVPYWLYGPEW